MLINVIINVKENHYCDRNFCASKKILIPQLASKKQNKLKTSDQAPTDYF